MTSQRAVLAIDAGQTAMKVRIVADGAARDEEFPGIRTHEPLLPQLAEVARAVILRSPAPITTVAAGVSGLTTKEADAEGLLARIEDIGVREVLLAHDATTSFLGAMGGGRGCVIAAGTGVVTLAVGRERVARVDGWGHIMGDAGSGYWIGREALDAVMRAYDGRGLPTALRPLAESRWPDLTAAYIALQSADDRVSVVASFAEPVARLTMEGDAVAAAITARAAAELAHSAATSLRQARVGEDEDEILRVCAIGGVFRSAPLRAAFAEHLRADGLEIVETPPLGHGIDGAAALADLSPQHPLAALVWAARA